MRNARQPLIVADGSGGLPAKGDRADGRGTAHGTAAERPMVRAVEPATETREDTHGVADDPRIANAIAGNRIV